jgi:putative transposase
MKNMVKNHCLAKSINDASWYQFRVELEYFGKVFEKVRVAVNPEQISFRMLEWRCNCEENAI